MPARPSRPKAARSARPDPFSGAQVTKRITRSPKKPINFSAPPRATRALRIVNYNEDSSENDGDNEDSEDMMATCMSRKFRTRASISDRGNEDTGMGGAEKSSPSRRFRSRQIIVDDDDDETDDSLTIYVPRDVEGKMEMVTEDGSAAKVFKNFPIEIVQNIADCLPSDQDVFNFSLVCQVTGTAITESVWRKRCVRVFDMAPALSTTNVCMKYKYRRIVSKKWACFDLGKFGGHIDAETREIQKENQDDCLNLFRSLILESNVRLVQYSPGEEETISLNLNFMCDLLTGSNGLSHVDIIDSVFSTEIDRYKSYRVYDIVTAASKDTLIYVVQLCLTALSLNRNMCNAKVSHFDISQARAYDTPATQPLFTGDWKENINVYHLLHTVNFFKYHFKANGEGLLTHAFRDLDEGLMPRFHFGRIQAGTQPLARHWKGAYTYMDVNSMWRLRGRSEAHDFVYTDALDGNEMFQDIDVFSDAKRAEKIDWPKEWDAILDSDPFKGIEQIQSQPGRTRSTTHQQNNFNAPSVKKFWGSCRGARKGHFLGHIHAVKPQQGIHGFQRITMMKCYTRKEGDFDVLDPDQVWAYEGCVLPGGTIIVGRYWHAGPVDGHSPPYDIVSGPFIWWNVDHGNDNDPIGENEAFNFFTQDMRQS